MCVCVSCVCLLQAWYFGYGAKDVLEQSCKALQSKIEVSATCHPILLMCGGEGERREGGKGERGEEVSIAALIFTLCSAFIPPPSPTPPTIHSLSSPLSAVNLFSFLAGVVGWKACGAASSGRCSCTEHQFMVSWLQHVERGRQRRAGCIKVGRMCMRGGWVSG